MNTKNTSQNNDTLNISGIEVRGTKPNFSRNMYEAMVKAAQSDLNIDFGEGVKLQEGIWNQEFLVQCDIDKTEELIGEYTRNYTPAPNKYNSFLIDGSRQVGEFVGSFEYEGKGFIILFPRNRLTTETIPERGVYKGVIVNPLLYFSEEAQKHIDDRADTTRRILDGE